MEGSCKVQNKTLLLLSMMKELAGDAHISFEGDLKGLRLSTVLGASHEPKATLKRNTLWPIQDFVIVPLGPTMAKEIMNALGETYLEE